MQALIEGARNLFSTGGWVMWPLAALSVLSVTLIVERFLFWGRAATATRRRWASLVRKLRPEYRDLTGAKALAEDDRTFLGTFALALIDEMKHGRGLSEVAAREAVETVRPAIERFSTTLSTIITAAPMLGILGTVTGIIRSFAAVGAQEGGGGGDPTLVADGISQALYTTAFGLLIAIVTLFPYVIFRARIDRALGRLELLAAAGMEESGGQSKATAPATAPANDATPQLEPARSPE